MTKAAHIMEKLAATLIYERPNQSSSKERPYYNREEGT